MLVKVQKDAPLNFDVESSIQAYEFEFDVHIKYLHFDFDTTAVIGTAHVPYTKGRQVYGFYRE